MASRVLVLFLVLPFTASFNAKIPITPVVTGRSVALSPLFHSEPQSGIDRAGETPLWQRVLDRFDTTTAAGIKDAKGAGPLKRIKGLHGPITYLALALMAGLKWKWCFRNPYYWFGVAFCVKWYRARYVFKIPVWDRQPNWNNIITSKEQEKDLKAFTCKQCGSTLFIAKTREFFFEGDTGIGGLGCFSCGAKGKENFTMDRDRIVEDVADMDDYFEYERPLDFVSRAERRDLLKEAGGDEEVANKLLVERAGGESDESESAVNGDASAESPEVAEEASVEETEEPKAEAEESVVPKEEVKPKKKKKSKKKKKKSKPVMNDAPPPSPDDFDALDMDAF